MSDSSYECEKARNKFRDHLGDYKALKAKKDDLERDLEGDGRIVERQEYERNNIVNKLRDKEQEIRNAKDDEDKGRLDRDRENIVAELRSLEERIRYARDAVKDKQGEHYQISSKIRDAYRDLENIASDVRKNCTEDDFGINLSIPSPD